MVKMGAPEPAGENGWLVVVGGETVVIGTTVRDGEREGQERPFKRRNLPGG